MGDPRRFQDGEARKAFEEALLRLAADDLPYITFTVSGRRTMIVADDLNRKMSEVATAIESGVNCVTYSEYLRAISVEN